MAGRQWRRLSWPAAGSGVAAGGARRACTAAVLRLRSTRQARGTEVAPLHRQALEEALADLRATPEEARHEGYPQPTQLALANAGRILHRMYALRPTRLEAYPTPDGEVAVVAPGNARRSAMVLCDSEGGVLCLVNVDGQRWRARYLTASSLPDGPLRDALREGAL